jgi:hypothetical protein
VRHEIPAAFPLIGLIAGLAIGPLLVNPILFAIGLALIASFCGATAALGRRGACGRARAPVAPLLFTIAGIALSLHVQHREQREHAGLSYVVVVVL